MTDTNTKDQSSTLIYAGLFRRLFAIFYDCFLLLAILLTVTTIANALNQGQAIEAGNNLHPLYVITIFGLSYLYFAWFWMHGGQSLGMKTWQIQLKSSDNGKISWKITAIRFVIALFSWGFFGIGFLWTLFDKKNLSWHDLVSKTVLIDLRSK